MLEILQPPFIPLLKSGVLDPDEVGSDELASYASYDNPQLGDQVYWRWGGKAADGTEVHEEGVAIPIDPPLPDEGVHLRVSNEIVRQLINGNLSYSYCLVRAGSKDVIESKRIHLTIAKQALWPAPQIKESNDLQVDIDGSVDEFTVAVPPFPAMADGDGVKLWWKGTRSNGKPGGAVGPFSKTLSSTDTDTTNNPGQVLSWLVPRSNFVGVRDGLAEVWYEVTRAGQSAPAVASGHRTFLIAAPLKPLLAAPSVKDLAGKVISPSLYPDGLMVVVPMYEGIQVADDVLVYGTASAEGSNVNKNTIQYLKVTASMIASGHLEVLLPHQWLLDNQGAAVNLRYQYARPDAAGSSLPLDLSVRAPLTLPTPTVEGSTLVDGEVQLDPLKAVEGAFIVIPASATISPEDKVIATWKGLEGVGEFETQTPSQSAPIKFKVPAKFIAPNFGKPVQVFYTVEGETCERPLTLSVRNLTSYPRMQCPDAQVGSPATLSLSRMSSSGARLNLPPWLYISTDQLVRVVLTGLDTSGRNIQRDIISRRNVTSTEVSRGLEGRLLRAQVQDIKLQSTFRVIVSVSFDGGQSMVQFPEPLFLQLLP